MENLTSVNQQESDPRNKEQVSLPESPENFHIETIEDYEADEILARTEIHGDEFMGKLLTTEILKDEQLSPKYKIRIGDSVIWFSSSVYELGKGRLAVVAYVEKLGKIAARSYYRSNSQGVWRYLPDYTIDQDGEIGWYGKGYSEESITLPVTMQKALSEITKEGMQILQLKNNPEFIFAGTAKKMGSKDKEYYQEIEATPKILEGNLYANYGKIPPEQISLDQDQSPDFSKLIISWKQKTGIYGEITVEVFPSKNGLLKFMFCKDSLGRAWIGGIEDNSKTQSTGLKKSWVQGGDLSTPAFEYKTGRTDQTGGYGNDEIRNGKYVDMYENYIQRIPIIQEYIKADLALESKITINEARSFANLYRAIDQIGGLQGSQQFYRPIELKSIINRVRRGELTIQYITNTGGLRDKVEYLMRTEKLDGEAAA